MPRSIANDPVREERVRAPVETGFNGKVEKAEVRTVSYPDLVCRVHWIGAQRVMSTSPVRPAPDRDRDTDRDTDTDTDTQ